MADFKVLSEREDKIVHQEVEMNFIINENPMIITVEVSHFNPQSEEDKNIGNNNRWETEEKRLQDEANGVVDADTINWQAKAAQSRIDALVAQIIQYQPKPVNELGPIIWPEIIIPYGQWIQGVGEFWQWFDKNSWSIEENGELKLHKFLQDADENVLNQILKLLVGYGKV